MMAGGERWHTTAFGKHGGVGDTLENPPVAHAAETQMRDACWPRRFAAERAEGCIQAHRAGEHFRQWREQHFCPGFGGGGSGKGGELGLAAEEDLRQSQIRQRQERPGMAS